MSALTGCKAGAEATGLVDPNKRADAYTECTDVMGTILGSEVKVSRKDVKAGFMTSFYGSTAQPKKIFGDDTPELHAFFEAVQTMAPGAYELLQDLLASWQDMALSHEWQLPDGYEAKVKVMKKIDDCRIEVDELDGTTFTYVYYENEGLPTGHPKSKSNVANVIHSVDAFILREMVRRCSYDKEGAEIALALIEAELLMRSMLDYDPEPMNVSEADPEFEYYLNLYRRSGQPSAVIFPYITACTVSCLTIPELRILSQILNAMLSHKPFPLITIHDSFGAHCNNVNQIRYWYKELLAELADSHILDDLLSQIYKQPVHFPKLSTDLSQYIRNSEYALS